MAYKRYIVHDFLVGSPILIDCEKKSFTFYDVNIYGQVLLKNPEFHTISTKKINGLIRRTNNDYSIFNNSYAVDRYIYTYIMNSEQRDQCLGTLEITALDEKIIETDDYAEAIKVMCEWAYKKGYSFSNQEEERDRLLMYCYDFLKGHPSSA